MHLTGSYLIHGSRDAVWTQLLNPQALAACVPGCRSLELVKANTYRSTITVNVGVVSGTFDGTVTLSDTIEPESYRLTVEGKGRPGFVKGSAQVNLTKEGDSTRVDVQADLLIGGLIASVGQRLLASVSKTMLDRFFACLSSRAQTASAQPDSPSAL